MRDKKAHGHPHLGCLGLYEWDGFSPQSWSTGQRDGGSPPTKSGLLQRAKDLTARITKIRVDFGGSVAQAVCLKFA